VNRQWVLARRPEGALAADDFRYQESPVPAPAEGGANVRVIRRDRVGGLIHEYSQVAWGDRIFVTHTSSVPCAGSSW
jgi:hypothetical protein